MLKSVKIFVSIAFAVILTSCQNSVELKNVKSDLKDIEYTENETDFDSIYEAIPKYSDICKNIQKHNLYFESEKLIDLKSIDLYQNTKETSMAVGMLVADLGYARYFQKVQVCTDLLDATKLLTSKLAINNDKFSEMLPIVEANINNEEVIFELIDSLLNSKDILVSNNEKLGLSSIALAGFWIETTHLGLNNDIQEADFEIIKNHLEILSQTNTILESISDNGYIDDVKSQLKNIEEKGYQSPTLVEDIENLRNKLVKRI